MHYCNHGPQYRCARTKRREVIQAAALIVLFLAIGILSGGADYTIEHQRATQQLDP
jgi:hypothetical protein